ncbi:MAG: arylsulfatase [Planktomarina sp.]|nr:arylsulfatase [Planktomarina sp.]|tara:strand:+ start:1056 stop:2546 length:1491 start_codon:yes stop_codon:yes gene_type:complete
MLSLILIASLFNHAQAAANKSSAPNIVIILADDLGWNDVGYHGSEINTPNIDRLAAEGLELDRFYAQPTCSPTRAALMTGKSPKTLGISRAIAKNQKTGLDLSERILPQRLNSLGYRSLMVGKWHLGNYTPAYAPPARGFEHFYGFLSGGIGYWDHNHGGGHDWQRNGKTIREEGYATHLLGDEAVQLIEQHQSQQPLFLYLAMAAPHMPNEAPQSSIDEYASISNPNRRIHAAMVTELDTQIGRVMDALKKRQMLNNTLILFASDNGGLSGDSPEGASVIRRLGKLGDFFFGRPVPISVLEEFAKFAFDGGSDNGLLRGTKTSTLEGGVRVPALLWWPEQIPAGTYPEFISVSDILPTFLEAVGGPQSIPEGIHGASQWRSLVKGEQTPKPDYLVTGFDNTALYQPPWKLITGDRVELYDVFADPTESNDMAALYPERVVQMQKIIQQWPAGEERGVEIREIIFDMDTFGGPEDRIPWAEAAIENAKKETLPNDN